MAKEAKLLKARVKTGHKFSGIIDASTGERKLFEGGDEVEVTESTLKKFGDALELKAHRGAEEGAEGNEGQPTPQDPEAVKAAAEAARKLKAAQGPKVPSPK